MSLNFYNILHLSSLFALALTLGALWALESKSSGDKKFRTFLLALHGILMFLIFLSGFGLIAKTKIPFPWPFWIYGKLLVWLALGVAPLMIKRAGFIFKQKKTYTLILFLVFALMFFALYLVRFQP